MATKRPHEESTNLPSKRAKNGFQIGPANLPEGTHKRKVQKIKKDLIHKAKVKRDYARFKAREIAVTTPRKSVYDREDIDGWNTTGNAAPEVSLEPHPQRLKMLGEAEFDKSNHCAEPRQRRPRPMPFEREVRLAEEKKKEEEARLVKREKAAEIRAQKLVERRLVRKQMAKARAGPRGQRKLGRESIVLLAKAEKLLG